MSPPLITPRVTCPPGLEYRQFQLDAIDFLACRKGAILGDDQGLGKTIEICGMINEDPSLESILIVCPVSVLGNWHDELSKWLTRKLSIGIWYSDHRPQTDIVIIPYSILFDRSKFLRERQWDLLVCDEAHFLKNPQAKRTRAIRGGRGTPRLEARKKIMVTGTPVPNRPIELWSLLNIIDPHTWPNLHEYGVRYCQAEYISFGGNGRWEYKGSERLTELHERIKPYLIRRRKADVLTELPNKVRQVIEIEPTDSVKKLLDRERDLASRCQAYVQKRSAFHEEVKSLKEEHTELTKEMSTIRREVGLAKAEVCAEYMNEIAEREGKVVVFAWHREVISILTSLTRFDYACIMGGTATTPSARRDEVANFQNDPDTRIFVGNILAAGAGITLTAACHVLFVEYEWVPGNMNQAEDRCHRIGQKDTVFVQHMSLRGSLDARIAKTLIHKQQAIDHIVDGHYPTDDGDWVATLANLNNEQE